MSKLSVALSVTFSKVYLFWSTVREAVGARPMKMDRDADVVAPVGISGDVFVGVNGEGHQSEANRQIGRNRPCHLNALLGVGCNGR